MRRSKIRERHERTLERQPSFGSQDCACYHRHDLDDILNHLEKLAHAVENCRIAQGLQAIHGDLPNRIHRWIIACTLAVDARLVVHLAILGIRLGARAVCRLLARYVFHTPERTVNH